MGKIVEVEKNEAKSVVRKMEHHKIELIRGWVVVIVIFSHFQELHCTRSLDKD